VLAVGVNCTAPQYIDSLVEQAQAHTRKPVLVYPNSGEQYDATHKQWHGNPSASHFAEQARGWHARGARLIGGCCRTSPEDIAAIHRWASAVI
jgi:homocysteine S-methyltransferase